MKLPVREIAIGISSSLLTAVLLYVTGAFQSAVQLAQARKVAAALVSDEALSAELLGLMTSDQYLHKFRGPAGPRGPMGPEGPPGKLHVFQGILPHAVYGHGDWELQAFIPTTGADKDAPVIASVNYLEKPSEMDVFVRAASSSDGVTLFLRRPHREGDEGAGLRGMTKMKFQVAVLQVGATWYGDPRPIPKK